MVLTTNSTTLTNTPVVTVTTSSTMTTTTAADPAPVTLPTEIASIAHFRLPGFWRHAPRQWFTHADAIFHTNRVRSDLSRVNHVLASLDDEGIRTVSDLLGDDASYSLMRERLISSFTASHSTRFQSIVQPGGMGDRTPSRLLRDMREVYPEGMPDTTLEQFWLAKLPTVVRTVIAGFSGPLDTLAERADRIFEACETREVAEAQTTPRVRCVAAFPPQHALGASSDATTLTTSPHGSSTLESRVQSLEAAIGTLSAQISQLLPAQTAQAATPNPASVPRTTHAEPGWCYYHVRYGQEARKCREPCTFAPPTRKNL